MELNGHKANQGEWTEVRRKTPKLSNEHAYVTSYYVSNLPDHINKLKIRKSFEVFGKVVDIFTLVGRKTNLILFSRS